MFGLENAIRAGCERAGDHDCAEDFAKRAAARRAAIDRYLWDPSRGVYLDYRWTRKQPIDHVTAATLYPLFTRVASEAQAASVAKAVEAELLKPGGIVTTTLDTGQQWDWPNGWAPLQWIAVEGLTSYGQNRLAETIACRWMVNVSRVYRLTGKLVEKYDVIATNQAGGGGEYPTQDGFGWTNGVMLKLMALYPADAELESADLCPAPGEGEASKDARDVAIRELRGRRRFLDSSLTPAMTRTPGACAAIRPSKSAARATLRAFTLASRPRVSTSWAGRASGAEAGALVDLFRHQHFAANRLGQVLETSGDIDRIADHRELRMALIADGAGDGHAGVDADAEADRLDQRMSQRAVQPLDPGGDRGAGGDRLPAGDVGRIAHAEQRQQPVAQHLVGLAAGVQAPRGSPR